MVVGGTPTPPTGPSPTDVAGQPVFDKGPAGCKPDKPCDECEGNCDVDVDCFGGLECFKRNIGQPVPGCAKAGYESTGAHHGYCYKPAVAMETTPGTALVTTTDAVLEPTPADNKGSLDGDLDRVGQDTAQRLAALEQRNAEQDLAIKQGTDFNEEVARLLGIQHKLQQQIKQIGLRDKPGAGTLASQSQIIKQSAAKTRLESSNNKKPTFDL